jgi:ABC-type sugar transport system ATPase subunit
VTHDQAEAMTLGNRVAVMNRGKLQQFETPLEIYNRPANRFVAEFVGSPGMNFIDGRIDLSQRRFVRDGLNLSVTDGLLEKASRAQLDACTLGIRPENVRVSNAQTDHWMPATVYVTELMGSETLVIVEANSQRLIARAPGDFRAETGSAVWVDFDLTKAHLFDRATGLRV